MNVITLEQPGRFTLSQDDDPGALAPGEALVRVRRVGVCGTDLHAYRGNQPFFTYPRILGHELGVEVVAVVEDGTNLPVGSRCAVEPYLECGQCIACRRGKPNCCAHLRVLGVHTDGGMRDFLRVPVRKLHPSATLSLDQLALVETLGIGMHAISRAALEPGEWALVIGAGPIGLSVIQFAQTAGPRVVVLDTNPHRLEFCRRHMQVEQTIGAGDDALERLMAITSGDLPTAVFDATGNAASMASAFRYVAPGGRLVLVGLVQADIAFHDPEFHRRELTLLASRNSTAADMRRIIALMEVGEVDTRPWITHRAACGQLPEEFPRWLDPESRVVKAMVEFGDDASPEDSL